MRIGVRIAQHRKPTPHFWRCILVSEAKLADDVEKDRQGEERGESEENELPQREGIDQALDRYGEDREEAHCGGLSSERRRCRWRRGKLGRSDETKGPCRGQARGNRKNECGCVPWLQTRRRNQNNNGIKGVEVPRIDACPVPTPIASRQFLFRYAAHVIGGRCVCSAIRVAAGESDLVLGPEDSVAGSSH